MHHVTNVNPNSDLDLPFSRSIGIALRHPALDFDGTLSRFQRAVELDEKTVADRFNFRAMETRKNFAEQPAMFLQQFQRKLVVALTEGAVAHHVGKHDGCQLALLSLGAHTSVRSTSASIGRPL